MSTTAAKMLAGRKSRDSGVSADATAGGTWLRIRNSLTSQLTAPALSKTAETPNSAAPRLVKSPAAQDLGIRAGRFGHHHDGRMLWPVTVARLTGRPEGRGIDDLT